MGATVRISDHPLIGYEYEYLGHPVKVLRVLPTSPSFVPSEAHVEFTNRFDQHSTCDAGELGKWQDIEKPLTDSQRKRITECLEDAQRNATNDAEKRLIRWQMKKLRGRP